MTSNYSKYLIEAEELKLKLNSPIEKLKNLRILDGTSFPPLDKRTREESFQEKRIIYSQLYDIDKIADLTSKFPHMMPTNEIFIENMKKMDIRLSDEIIIYDRISLFGSPRILFTFLIFGHKNLKILNGGFSSFEKINGQFEFNDNFKVNELNNLREKAKEEDYNYKLDKSKIIDLKNIIRISNSKMENEEIIDARSEERFYGKIQEPRPSLRLGNIKNSKCVFFKNLIDENGKYYNEEKIKNIFQSKGVDLNKKMLICSCGTGLTACIDIGALIVSGFYDKCVLYDGSWIEYGNLSLEEIEKIGKE